MRLVCVVGILAMVGASAPRVHAQASPGSNFRYDFLTGSVPPRAPASIVIRQAPKQADVVEDLPVQLRPVSRAIDCAMPTLKADAGADARMPVAAAPSGTLPLKLITVPPCAQK